MNYEHPDTEHVPFGERPLWLRVLMPAVMVTTAAAVVIEVLFLFFLFLEHIAA